MKILMTGPDNNPAKSLGGIVTVINMILNNAGKDIFFFNRDLGSNYKILTYIKNSFRFHLNLKKHTFNLVHFHFSFDRKSVIREFFFIWLTKRKGISIVMHLHGGQLTFERNKSTLVKWILKTANCLIVLNEAEKESLCHLYNIEEYKIHVLRNCIDFKEIRLQPGILKKYSRLIFFGRIDKAKGLKEIVEALSILKSRSIDFAFDVFGTGPDEEWFISSLKKAIGERFQYKGLVWGEQKWRSLNDSDVFLLPSYGEGMPMALLEAMALGKTVLVSDDESFRKVVTDNVNGLLVRKKDSADLAGKIEWILGNRKDQERIGENARATIQNNYSSDYYMKSLNSIYHMLITN